jgi:putative transposase
MRRMEAPGFLRIRRSSVGGLERAWFTSLAHAQVVIESWRREYNEERPKKALSGLTPAAYAKQLAMKTVTVTPDSDSNRY